MSRIRNFIDSHPTITVIIASFTVLSLIIGPFAGVALYKSYSLHRDGQGSLDWLKQQRTSSPAPTASSQAIRTTAPTPKITSSPQMTVKQPASTFDCASFNSSQRAIYVQAGEALYANYTSRKAYVLSPTSEYAGYDASAKQALLDNAYITYETKMDINNSKYLQGLAIVGHNCYTYYQKIPYSSS